MTNSGNNGNDEICGYNYIEGIIYLLFLTTNIIVEQTQQNYNWFS